MQDGFMIIDPNQLIGKAKVRILLDDISGPTLARYIKAGLIRQPLKLMGKSVWRAGDLLEDISKLTNSEPDSARLSELGRISAEVRRSRGRPRKFNPAETGAVGQPG